MRMRWVAPAAAATLIAAMLLIARPAPAQRDYQTGLTACTNNEATLLAAHPNRRRALVWNLSAQTVWIHGATRGSGWPLHAASQPLQAHALMVIGSGEIRCSVTPTQAAETAHVRTWAEFD